MCFKAVGREEGAGESQRLELCTAIASLYGSHSTDGHTAIEPCLDLLLGPVQTLFTTHNI